jgi:DNA repair protein RadC
MNIHLKKDQRIKVNLPSDLYPVMKAILMRESKTDRGREHFWTVSLDNANRILNIELISMGTATKTLAEPMEVFSIPLQKRAIRLMLVHNHPSGQLLPSKEDKDLTDKLIQCGHILNLPVIDHLIITEESYYSFALSGIMDELEQSTRYVPGYEMQRRYEKAGTEKGKDERSKEIAREMKRKGIDPEIIAEVTGLSVASVKKLKT